MCGCIYIIQNKVPNHDRFGWVYIGKAKDVECLLRRMKAHCKGKGNKLLSNDIKKYSVSNFRFKIHAVNTDNDITLDIEEAFINKYNCVYPNGYNFTYGGEGGIPWDEKKQKQSITMKGRHLTEETKQKISIAMKGKRHTIAAKLKMSNLKIGVARARETLSRGMKGKHHTEETKRKIGAKSRGRLHTSEAKLKMSMAQKGRTVSEEARQKISMTRKCAEVEKRVAETARGLQN